MKQNQQSRSSSKAAHFRIFERAADECMRMYHLHLAMNSFALLEKVFLYPVQSMPRIGGGIATPFSRRSPRSADDDDHTQTGDELQRTRGSL